MAHEISITAAGKAEMAFVGKTPWHGLGQEITKGASIGVWTKEAGFDWHAEEAPAIYRAPLRRPGVFADEYEVEGSKVLYRSDTCAALGIVGSGYKPVQPADCLEFFREMTEDGGWHIHTAGVLRGGKKLWVMATNGQVDSLGMKGGDQVIRQLLLATSLDGSMKTVVKPVSTVVVCANTLAMALREGGKTVTVSHRSAFDADAVRRALGLADGSFESFLRKAREMADTPVKMDEALYVIRQVFGGPAPAVKVDTSWMGKLADLAEQPEIPGDEDDGREKRSAGRVLELFTGEARGAGLKGRKGTRWGLFNAITEHVDHDIGRTADTRLDSAWFGRGDAMKQAAFELCASA